VLLGGAAIFLAMAVLVTYALSASPRRRAWIARTGFVITAGIGFPAVVLSALLIHTLRAAVYLADAPTVRIAVTGEQWWWRVEYLDAAGATQFATANEIHIPIGQPVELALASADVIHSFWMPNLAGKLDMIPGRMNRLRLSADRPGVIRGQCAEYCGAAHAHMALYLVAVSSEEYERWLTRQRLPASAPANAALEHGQALFMKHGCGACHKVRGTPAVGTAGPDLTHVGSRPSIGAGTLPNNAGTLGGWIASSQHIKPGNHMPSFRTFSGVELRAVAAWLESLK
jgi:cytochrome c oxidase subunit 2